jgi:hypothetical protein
MMIFGASPSIILQYSIPLSLVLEHHSDVGSWNNPEPRHMIPPPDSGCIAANAIEQHSSRQKHRYLEIRDQVGASGEGVFLRAGRRLSRGGMLRSNAANRLFIIGIL